MAGHRHGQGQKRAPKLTIKQRVVEGAHVLGCMQDLRQRQLPQHHQLDTRDDLQHDYGVDRASTPRPYRPGPAGC